MASIVYDQFGGIFPRLDPRKLPPGAAQTAHNCDLTSGDLVPINVVNDFEALHDSAGAMKAGFPSSDIDIITKADPPTLNSSIRMCIPMEGGSNIWLSVISRMWASYIDPGSGNFYVDLVDAQTLAAYNVTYTPTGFITNYRNLSNMSDPFYEDISYTIHGPLFAFNFFAEEDYKGGPEETVWFPNNTWGTYSDPRIPTFSVPLTYPISMSGYDAGDGTGISRFQYGSCTCIDAAAPDSTGRYSLPEGVTGPVTTTFVPANSIFSFTFDCNYVINTQRTYFYIQQMIDSEDRDGPQSDASEEVIVEPGEIVRLNTPQQAGYTKNRLFKSSTSSESGFRKLEDVDGTEYFDNFREALTTNLPPNGNVPHATPVEAVQGALAHPAGYYMYFYENELRPSSEWIDEGRPWAVPEEYAIAFDTPVLCQALAGGSILAFTLDQGIAATGTLTNAESGETSSIEVTYAVDPGNLSYTGFIEFTDTTERVSYNAISGTGLTRTFAVAVTLVGTYAPGDPVLTSASPVGGVFRVTGQHPARLSRYEIANVSTILNRRSLWRIDSMIGWVTDEGLVVFDGASPALITKEHFTSDEWAQYLPSSMSAYANDRSVFLVLPDSLNRRDNVRFDMRGNQLIACSTFDSFNAVEAQWRGPIEVQEKFKGWRWVKVISREYPVRLLLYGDGQVECDIHVLSSDPQLLPRVNKAKEWEVEIYARGAGVSRVAIGDNSQEV